MVRPSAIDQTVERRAERTADTRYRIERAALEHFVKQGVPATSIRDIADTAGVSSGAMYNHFESKDQLAWHLFITGWTEFGRDLLKRAREQRKLADQLTAMIQYVFRRFLREGAVCDSPNQPPQLLRLDRNHGERRTGFVNS